MDTSIRTATVVAIIFIASLLLLFGGGMATGTMLSGEMAGIGNMEEEVSWMLLPTFLVVVLGAVLLSVSLEKN